MDMMKKAIFTVDTEGHDGKDPISHLIFGEIEGGKQAGIPMIMDLCDQYHVKGLFFVDFAEAWDYGEEKVKRVVDTILNRGHNVGVHIHPDHMADKNRLFLWEYTYDEQFEIIKKCTDLYEKLVGKKPTSFRAGKYAANLDTLNILCELGYKYDFSSFYHQQWCGIDPYFTVNAPCRYKSLIEFPVTMHSTFQLGTLKREDKIDVEGMSKGELRFALKQVAKQDFPIIVTLFFHSFSFLKWRRRPDSPQISKNKINKLKKSFECVTRHPDIEFISEADLHLIEPANKELAEKSWINWGPRPRGIWYTFEKAVPMIKYNRKARHLVIGTGLFVLGIVGLIVRLFI